MESFLDPANRIGVVGVSTDTKKWGYKVWKHLLEEDWDVYPINPKYEEIEGHECFPSISSIGGGLDMVITVVPPEVTEEIVEECAEVGIKRIWMQPGSESEDAILLCKENGIEVVHDACMVTDGLKQEFAV
jgi:uncharacterized protein